MTKLDYEIRESGTVYETNDLTPVKRGTETRNEVFDIE